MDTTFTYVPNCLIKCLIYSGVFNGYPCAVSTERNFWDKADFAFNESRRCIETNQTIETIENLEKFIFHVNF